MKTLRSEVHTLLELLRPLNISPFESLVSALEESCSDTAKQLETRQVKSLPRLAGLGEAAVDLLGDLTTFLAEKPSPVAWFLDKKREASYDALFSKINRACQERA